MKKTVTILLILFSCLSMFAIENKLSLNFSPMVFQGQRTAVVVNKDKDVDSEWSSYGIGGEAIYKFFVWDNFYTELGVDFDSYFYKGKDYKCLNVMGFAGVGYRYVLNEKYLVFAHIAFGADSILKDKVQSKNIVIKLGAGASYSISEKWTLDCELDGTFGFARKQNSNYSNSEYKNYTQYSTFRIIPYFGATYSF